MTGSLRPRKKPCATCPYRQDVPSGIWDGSEYAKLTEYDKPTAEQPVGVFMCHQQDGCMCAGWIGAHDPSHLLALRFAGAEVDWDAIDQFKTTVPLHPSGRAAAEHGMKDLQEPGEKAQEQIEKLLRVRALREEKRP